MPGNHSIDSRESTLDAASAYVTLGEIMGVMRTVFGEYKELVMV